MIGTNTNTRSLVCSLTTRRDKLEKRMRNCWSFDRKAKLKSLFEWNARISLWNAQNSWFRLKSVSTLGIGDWRLSRKTYEMRTYQVKSHFERHIYQVNLWLVIRISKDLYLVITQKLINLVFALFMKNVKSIALFLKTLALFMKIVPLFERPLARNCNPMFKYILEVTIGK